MTTSSQRSDVVCHPNTEPSVPQLYLHVGPPMTGAAAIQSWLAQNETALRAFSLFVLPQHHAHRLAVEGIASQKRRAAPDVTSIMHSSLEDAEATLKQAAGSAVARIVISSQYFSLCDPDLVRRQLSAAGADQVKIVFVLRRQDRFLESMYMHAVKALGQSAPLPAPHYRKDMDWFELILPWTRVFQRESIVLHDYDDLIGRGKPVAAALLEPMDEFTAAFAGKSEGDGQLADKPVPAALLEFQRLANVAGAQGVLPLLESSIPGGMAGVAFRMDPIKARQVLALYRESNRKVAREFLGRDGGLFDESDLDQETTGADYTGALPVDMLAMLFALHLKEEKAKLEEARAAAAAQPSESP